MQCLHILSVVLTILLMHISSLGSPTAHANSLQVYVSKSGQELSGQIAYRQYRKVHIKTSTCVDILVLSSLNHELFTFAFGRRVEQGLES